MNEPRRLRVALLVLFALAAAHGCGKKDKPASAPQRDAGGVASRSIERRPILSEAQWREVARELPGNRYLPSAARGARTATATATAATRARLRPAIEGWLEVRASGKRASKESARLYAEVRMADLVDRQRLVDAVARSARGEVIDAVRAEVAAQIDQLERWQADNAQPVKPARRRYVCHREPSSLLFCIDEVELIRHLDKIESFDEANIFQVLFELEALGALGVGNAMFHCGDGRWSVLETGSLGQLVGDVPALIAGVGRPSRTAGGLGPDLELSDMLAMSVVCARDQASGSRGGGQVGGSVAFGIGGTGSVPGGPSECAQDAIGKTDEAMEACRDTAGTTPTEGGSGATGSGGTGSGDGGESGDNDGSNDSGSGGSTGSGAGTGNGGGGSGTDGAGAGGSGRGSDGGAGAGSGSTPSYLGPIPNPAPSNSGTLVAALRAIAKALGSFGSNTPVDPALDPIISGTWDVSGDGVKVNVNILGRDVSFDCGMEGGGCPATCREKQLAWEFAKHQCHGRWDVAGSWCAQMTGCKGNCADPTITTPTPDRDDVCSQEMSEEDLADLQEEMCNKMPYSSVPLEHMAPDCDAGTGKRAALAELFAEMIVDERCGPRGYSLDCGITRGVPGGIGTGSGSGSGVPPKPFEQSMQLKTEIRNGQVVGRPISASSLRIINTFAVDYSTFETGWPP